MESDAQTAVDAGQEVAPSDTNPPSTPSGLAATASSSSQIALTWGAATDNVGVATYSVEMCTGAGCSNFAQVATTSATGATISGLTGSTAYSYRVRASDAAGNFGAYSAVASATTQTQPATATPAYVQGAYAVPNSGTTVNIPYPAAQTAGNLNVVVVGWNDGTSKSITSVSDSRGNVYSLAVGPTVLAGQLSQSIYYAKNITATAGSNTVSVLFNKSVAYPDIRILEYSGIDPTSPFDVAVGAQGNSATANSGTVTTLNSTDLLVGANMTTGATSGAGTGFTSRMITVPDGDIAEDRNVTSAARTRQRHSSSVALDG